MSDHDFRTTEDANEMRIELPETEPPPEVDPQAERRAEIAEAYKSAANRRLPLNASK